VLRKDAKIELLKGVPLFARCNKKQLAAIAQLSDLVGVPAGTELIRQGNVGQEFMILVEGSGVVSRNGRRINTIGPGDFVGETALLTGAPRNATVKVTSPATLLALTRGAFWDLLDRSPDIQKSVLQAVADRLPPQPI
jgi:CRP-like cAMP-binding protein